MLSGSDVTTDKSVRFCFWDKEELGLYGRLRLRARPPQALQGTMDEPTWLGLIQHDMILYDHGAGTRTTAQSAYADLDVEWRAGTTKEADSKALALKWRFANGTYAPDYPATAYNYSTNTDDTAFHPYGGVDQRAREPAQPDFGRQRRVDQPELPHDQRHRELVHPR